MRKIKYIDDDNALGDLVRHHYKFLNSGACSQVYKNKDTCSIIKCTSDVAYLSFIYNVVLKNKNIHFPKIYEIIEYRKKRSKNHAGTLLVVEKLNSRMKRGIINKTTNKIFEVIPRHSYGDEFKDNLRFPNSFRECMKIMRKYDKKAGPNFHSIDIDIQRAAPHNIMFRGNNDLVIIDPFY